jgi:hypothetical protein
MVRAQVLLCGLLAAALSLPAFAESTYSCPAGTYDIVDWMTLDSDLRATKHLTGTHDLYTVVWPDKFYWLKNSAGDTWDINLFDSTGVYWWITEYAYNTPRAYKKATSDYNFKATPRCVSGGLPGTTSLVPDTSYDIVRSCAYQSTQGLGNALFEVWGPYKISLGGSLPNNMPVLVLAYYWDCDSWYGNCATKENYYLSQRYGLVRWEVNQLVNGSYQLQSVSTFNQLVNGTIAPYFPCF